MADRLHLSGRHRRAIEALLCEHLPGVEAWAYGSRVNGRSHDGSDLDLVLRGPGLAKIPVEQLACFEEAARESTIPFLVEVRDWARLPQRFCREIERDKVVLADGMDASRPKPQLQATCTRTVCQSSNGWTERQLGDLTENFDAIRVPVKEADRRSGPYPYYGASGVVDHVDKYLFDGEYLLVAEDGENLRTRQTPISYLVNGKFWVNNHAHILRGNKHANTRYLMYALSSLDVSGYLTGSTMPKLTQRNLTRVGIPTPPLREQRSIADILGTLDDKIELNHRMNETLEAIARAIFQDWFVDFGPVRAKADGCKPYLPAQLWNLFPEELDDEGNALGWSFGPLTDLAELNPESWSSRSAPEEIEYVDLANTKWGSIDKTHRYPWQDAPSRARRILRVGDTIVGTVRPGNGSFALVGTTGLTGSTGFAVLRPRARRHTALVFLSATAPDNIERLANLADGAAYPAVRSDVVGETQVTIPNGPTVTMFSALLTPVLDRIESNKAEAQKLAQTRDLLLPKLISGEIRVPQAGKLAEAVT